MVLADKELLHDIADLRRRFAAEEGRSRLTASTHPAKDTLASSIPQSQGAPTQPPSVPGTTSGAQTAAVSAAPGVAGQVLQPSPAVAEASGSDAAVPSQSPPKPSSLLVASSATGTSAYFFDAISLYHRLKSLDIDLSFLLRLGVFPAAQMPDTSRCRPHEHPRQHQPQHSASRDAVGTTTAAADHADGCEQPSVTGPPSPKPSSAARALATEPAGSTLARNAALIEDLAAWQAVRQPLSPRSSTPQRQQLSANASAQSTTAPCLIPIPRSQPAGSNLGDVVEEILEEGTAMQVVSGPPACVPLGVEHRQGLNRVMRLNVAYMCFLAASLVDGLANLVDLAPPGLLRSQTSPPPPSSGDL